jgi:tetratricopeptide (TPR) repeat protein
LGKSNSWLADPKGEVAEDVRLARRAVAIGKDDPAALAPGGGVLGYLAGELENGITLVDRAIHLNPNLAMAWNFGGFMRTYLGEHAGAIEHFERAIRLSPLDLLAYLIYAGISEAHLFAGRYEEAVSWARKAALEKADWATPERTMAIACAPSGRIVEAREALDRMRAIEPDYRLSIHLARIAPWRRAEDRALIIEGLLRAGLPE